MLPALQVCQLERIVLSPGIRVVLLELWPNTTCALGFPGDRRSSALTGLPALPAVLHASGFAQELI